MIVQGRLGDSDHEMIQFAIQRKVGRVTSTAQMLDFRKANFDVLRAVVREALGAQGVASTGVQERWSFLKEAIFGVQQDVIPLRRKAGNGSKKPSWLSVDIQAGLRAKKKAYWRWKQGQGPRRSTPP